MITRAKKQRLTATNSITTTADPKPSSRNHHKAVKESPSKTKGKRKAREQDVSVSDGHELVADTNNVIQHDQETPQQHWLPSNIMTLIFQHLSPDERHTLYQCTLCSRQCHAIANPLLWQVLRFDNNYINAKCFVACLYELPQERQQVLRQYIRDLRLSGPQWTEARLARLLPNMPDLKHFSLYPKTMITDKSFQHLPRYCQQLTSLQLDSTRLTQVSFLAIGEHCRQLCDVEWKVTKDQSPEWLSCLASCPVTRLRLDVVQSPPSLNERVMATIQQFQTLTHLTIRTAASTPINPRLLVPTTTNDQSTVWPQLTHLTLSPCTDVNDTTMIPFIQSHPHLQELELTHATQLTDATLDAMAGCLSSHLKRVALTKTKHLSLHALERLKQQCPRVEQVSTS